MFGSVSYTGKKEHLSWAEQRLKEGDCAPPKGQLWDCGLS